MTRTTAIYWRTDYTFNVTINEFGIYANEQKLAS